MPRQDSPMVKIKEVDSSADPWGYIYFDANDLVPDGTTGTTIEAYGTDETQQMFAFRCTQSEGDFAFYANWAMPMDYMDGGRVVGYVRWAASATCVAGAVSAATMAAFTGTIRATHPLYGAPTATETNTLSTTVNAAGASVGTNVWLADNYAYTMTDFIVETEIALQPTKAGALYPNDGTSGLTLNGDLFQWKIDVEGTLFQKMKKEVLLFGAIVKYEKGFSTDR